MSPFIKELANFDYGYIISAVAPPPDFALCAYPSEMNIPIERVKTQHVPVLILNKYNNNKVYTVITPEGEVANVFLLQPCDMFDISLKDLYLLLAAYFNYSAKNTNLNSDRLYHYKDLQRQYRKERERINIAIRDNDPNKSGYGVF